MSEKNEVALAGELEAIARPAADRLRAHTGGDLGREAALRRAVGEAAGRAIVAGLLLAEIADAERIGQRRTREELGAEVLRRVERDARRKLRDARERFVAAARDGRTLNKHGHRYKPRAIDNIKDSLELHVEPVLGNKRLSDVRRGDVQAIVDELAPTFSGSRVRSVVNAIRSLYRWAQDRDLASHDPAALVRLPAMDPTPIDRVASPAEFANLLAALSLENALPYALAGYAMGRRAQIVRLLWEEVDLQVGAIEWGVEWEARKYEASRRVVPVVPPLLAMLKRAYLEQGRPDGKQLVCPPRGPSRSGRLDTSWLGVRARKAWEKASVTPITLQESRHTAATWLDAAGVPPKIASVLMGHATPAPQPGAAQITLARYTHALPEDMEGARKKLAAYLAKHQEAKANRQ